MKESINPSALLTFKSNSPLSNDELKWIVI